MNETQLAPETWCPVSSIFLRFMSIIWMLQFVCTEYVPLQAKWVVFYTPGLRRIARNSPGFGLVLTWFRCLWCWNCFHPFRYQKLTNRSHLSASSWANRKLSPAALENVRTELFCLSSWTHPKIWGWTSWVFRFSWTEGIPLTFRCRTFSKFAAGSAIS